MKIVSVSMVKNESDIIESFVRYTLNIVDEMIILDNGSTDETLTILENLIAEGLPISIIYDEDTSYKQDIKTTNLLNKAVKEYGADLVCVLDVDEFIFSNNGQHPRKILEEFDLSSYYLIKFFNYIPTGSDDMDIKFIPERITHFGGESLEFYKVIVPKDIVNNYNVKVTMGNHDLIFKGKHKYELVKYHSNLNIAHYPIRSKEQCMSKILVGWPNLVAVNTENTGYGAHWKQLFNKIKRDNDLSMGDVEYFSKFYISMDDPEHVELKEQAINLDFCNDIEIKYDINYNYLSNILDSYVYFANEVALLRRELDLKTGNASIVDGIKMKIIDLITK